LINVFFLLIFYSDYLKGFNYEIKEVERMTMSPESRRLAGILLILIPAVAWGGASILTFLINDPQYMQNALRQDLWRAGHAHAGVLLILSLVALLYVDKANLSDRVKQIARNTIPIAAILMPLGFFLAVLTPDATSPNAFIYLTYLGGVSLVVGVLLLGIGLIRKPSKSGF
jgi:glucan phosphoethanolaminetransferase (alkaline phosphatase superfamily)